MIDYDEIRKEVAIQHNMLLDKDDPLLIAASLNETILKHCVKTLNAALEQGNTEAKKTGSRVITEAANYVSEQVHTAVSSAMKEALAQINKELGKARQETQIAKKTAVIAAAVSCICTVATVAVAINVF